VLRFAAAPRAVALALERRGWIAAACDLDTAPGSFLNLWGEVEVQLRPPD
jgi:hypothetical protein